MTDTPPSDLGYLSGRDFQRLAKFIQDTCGIRMPPVKKTMLEGRLRRRVRALGLPSLSEYCRWLFDHGRLAEEAVELIDAVTTNKTDFFREPRHFEHLTGSTLPTLLETPARPGLDRPLKVWSAACSSGSEPYTLAMVLDDFARRQRGYRFEILATDICTDALAKAKRAIYPEEMIAPVPAAWRQRYFLRSRNPDEPTVRLAPSVRQMVRFGRLNLMDEVYPLDEGMDIIFCRNILIYFDRERQEAVLRRLCGLLRPHGSLFLGHTDTIAGMDLPVRQVAPSVFIRR
ncbi:MAG: protein-glutamate O-methyltransferase [Alphaproteobacteria bacterium]|nr:protein-glutamate O-methyltransferase [Alphaproteobacteria bacterium]